MKINFNNKQVTTLIIESLKQQRSLFVLRIGDGEMLYFDENLERATNHCQQTLGYVLTMDEINEVRKSLNECIFNANILGLPTEYHRKSGAYWKAIESYYISLKSAENSNWMCDKFCSIDLHYELLEDDCYGKILRNVKKLFLVSSRDVKEKIYKKFQNIESIEQYLITGEQVYETIKVKSFNFIQQIKNIEKIINSKSRESELLLYGAGFIGKTLGLNFSNSGGVAVDIGSVFDSWVGKNTRGLNKGAESYITPLL